MSSAYTYTVHSDKKNEYTARNSQYAIVKNLIKVYAV